MVSLKSAPSIFNLPMQRLTKTDTFAKDSIERMTRKTSSSKSSLAREQTRHNKVSYTIVCLCKIDRYSTYIHTWLTSWGNCNFDVKQRLKETRLPAAYCMSALPACLAWCLPRRAWVNIDRPPGAKVCVCKCVCEGVCVRMLVHLHFNAWWPATDGNDDVNDCYNCCSVRCK